MMMIFCSFLTFTKNQALFKQITIKNITIIYSLSVGSIENKKKEILIDEVVGKISNILTRNSRHEAYLFNRMFKVNKRFA